MVHNLNMDMSVDNILYEKIPGAQCAFITFESFISRNEDSKDLINNLAIKLVEGNHAKPWEACKLANELYLHYLRTKLNVFRQFYQKEMAKRQPLVINDDDLY